MIFITDIARLPPCAKRGCATSIMRGRRPTRCSWFRAWHDPSS